MGKSGKALRQVLDTYGISQNRLAVVMGIARSTASHWFNETRDPSAEAVTEIIKALRQIDAAAAEEFVDLIFRTQLTTQRRCNLMTETDATPDSIKTNANLSPLHTQNPIDRFSNRAEDYASYRPGYPQAAIDLILADLGQPSELVIADIGAGTGISARLFAERGAQVWAIEPNAAMREAAAPHPRVEFRAATAEQTGLADRSVDLITCCQSFHWFEPDATLTEFHRILKPAGRVALMWNERNFDDEYTRQHSEIVNAAGEQGICNHVDRKSSSPLAASPRFTNFRTHTLTSEQSLDWSSLIGLVRSASYTPKAGAAYEQMMHDLRALFDRWTQQTGSNRVVLSYQTKLYFAEPV